MKARFLFIVVFPILDVDKSYKEEGRCRDNAKDKMLQQVRPTTKIT